MPFSAPTKTGKKKSKAGDKNNGRRTVHEKHEKDRRMTDMPSLSFLFDARTSTRY